MTNNDKISNTAMQRNILITSAGQRVVLTEIFKNSLATLHLEGKVFTTDMNPRMAPAGYVSDGCFEVERCTAPTYITHLLELCQLHDIGILVPTIDTELLILAQHKEAFAAAGIHVMVSDESFISKCRDKRKTAKLFANLGIDVPREIDKFHPTFPLFAKPYDGSLSTNLHVIRHQEELTSELLADEKLIFMEYINPEEFKEFTVDMYYGSDHQVKSIVPRERLKIRAGEINKGITQKNSLVAFLKKRMDYLPGVVGCICIQLFYRETDERVYGIEINPRFGGGYPLSYYAGANFAEFMLREYCLGEKITYQDNWKNHTLMLRYDREIIVHEG